MSNSTATISPQAAIVYAMVIVSASDSKMSDSELLSIGEMVKTLPIFSSFSQDQLMDAAQACADVLGDDEGLETALKMISSALPDQLKETAYALAVEIAAADGKVAQEELRILEMLRYRLPIDKLPAAAIERTVRARHSTL